MTTLRAGIVARLATISGLRVPDFLPPQINPPIAVVKPDSIDYGRSFSSSGVDTYRFSIMVLVGQVSERTAQTKLDLYCSATGALSIPAAFTADPTLGGAAPRTARVSELRTYQSVPVGEINYLGAEFVLEVTA